MAALHPSGAGSAAVKYDLLTLLGIAGLSSGSAATIRSMLRLITLVTARYDWRAGELTVGQREIARLWAVDERTVKREMARLRARGLIVLRRPGARGRVAAYAVNFEVARAVCDWSRVGPDFAARMASQDPLHHADAKSMVIPFPAAGLAAAPTEDGTWQSDGSEWSIARRSLKRIGEAAHRRWIAPLSRAGRSGDRLVLQAPSAFHATQVERTYGDAIARALAEADPTLRTVRIVAPDDIALRM
jgi:hypothetical protein